MKYKKMPLFIFQINVLTYDDELLLERNEY